MEGLVRGLEVQELEEMTCCYVHILLPQLLLPPQYNSMMHSVKSIIIHINAIITHIQIREHILDVSLSALSSLPLPPLSYSSSFSSRSHQNKEEEEEEGEEEELVDDDKSRMYTKLYTL